MVDAIVGAARTGKIGDGKIWDTDAERSSGSAPARSASTRSERRARGEVTVRTPAVERLRHDLDALDRGYSSGHHGLWSAQACGDLRRRARGDVRRARSGRRCGADGRGWIRSPHQLPRSDLDLLVVHDGADPVGAAGIAERLLYPLWDGGFEVGPRDPDTVRMRRPRGRTSRCVHGHARDAVPRRRRVDRR